MPKLPLLLHLCVWGGRGGGEERGCVGVSQDGMWQNHHYCGICVRVGGREGREGERVVSEGKVSHKL